MPSASSCLHLQQPRTGHVTTEQTVSRRFGPGGILLCLHCGRASVVPANLPALQTKVNILPFLGGFLTPSDLRAFWSPPPLTAANDIWE